MRFVYDKEVLDELLRHGIRPRSGTPPARAYELLKSIYCFEIRDLKQRRREVERVFGPQPLADYATALASLREKYAVLKRPAHTWVSLG